MISLKPSFFVLALAMILVARPGTARADAFDPPAGCAWREWPPRLPGAVSRPVFYCPDPVTGKMRQMPFVDSFMPDVVERARKGDVDAMALTGMVYAHADRDKGKALFDHAYEKGSGVAAFWRAMDAEAEHDRVKAAEFHRIAAERGNADGMLSLSLAYRLGDGVKQDDMEAARWLRAAAEHGNLLAMQWLGDSCIRTGCPKIDTAEAIRWYEKAAAAGSSDAMFALASVYREGQGGAAVSPALEKQWTDRAQGAVRQAKIWLLNDSAPDDPRGAYAENDIALAYLRGLVGFKQDTAEAIRWFETAAGHGSSAAADELSGLYREGRLVPQDKAAAERWTARRIELQDDELRVEAENGNVGAMRRVADMELSGKDGMRAVRKDEADAARWYRKAAENGDAKAMSALSKLYESGTGVAKDGAEAKRWSDNAAAAEPALFATTDALLADVEKRDSLTIIMLAMRLAREPGRMDEALFWHFEGALRARAYVDDHPDAWQGVADVLSTGGAVLGMAALADLPKFAETVDKVIAWDERHTDPYSGADAHAKEREKLKAFKTYALAHPEEARDVRNRIELLVKWQIGSGTLK